MNKNSKPQVGIYLQLFWEFFKLGLFTFGGGMAMIPLMQGIVVDKKHWLTEEEVIDCIAVSQGLPGVIAINMATYVGNAKKGIKGAICSTAGVILPSFLVIIAVIQVLDGIGDNRYVNGALIGIRSAATALIAYSLYKVAKQAVKNVFAVIVALVAFVLIVLGLNSVWVIVGSIAVGIIYENLRNRKHGDEVNGGDNHDID